MKAEHTSPSKNLLFQVRAGFVAQGTSLAAWCREQAVVRRTAEQALTGENRSANAAALVHRLKAAAGLPTQESPQ